MYTETHKVLLTYIRSVRYIESNDLLNSFTFIFENLGNQEGEEEEEPEERPSRNLLDQYITDINSKIAGQGFKIDRKNHELTGDLYYIFINTSSDDIIKESSAYNTSELTVIKTLIRDIIESDDYTYSLGKTKAIQIVSSNTNKNLTEAEGLVDRLIDDGWFVNTIEERLLLSIKSISELKEYLIDTYGSDENDGKVLLCRQCKEIVTLGYMTPPNEPFHRKCYDVYCRSKQKYPEEESELVIVGPDPSTL
ncbi:DNA repair protein, putative [Candida maltosa Xu316]|uniref:Non-structural maintenance of chromosomes element 1 homolog n=1 Tax=Candida maltosa (strain Xu316) TaxID=1245528 RepID=M3INA1_CANMX|nr:DNA repair protein, putative [Candida maltosa Xu316]